MNTTIESTEWSVSLSVDSGNPDLYLYSYDLSADSYNSLGNSRNETGTDAIRFAVKPGQIFFAKVYCQSDEDAKYTINWGKRNEIDVVILVDTTYPSIYEGGLNRIRENSGAITDALFSKLKDCRIAVADFRTYIAGVHYRWDRDLPLPEEYYPYFYPYKAIQSFTTDKSLVDNSLAAMRHFIGSWREDYCSNYYAMWRAAEGQDLGAWRPNARKYIILIQSNWSEINWSYENPYEGYTPYTTADFLRSKGVKVFATALCDNCGAPWTLSQFASSTGGQYYSSYENYNSLPKLIVQALTQIAEGIANDSGNTLPPETYTPTIESIGATVQDLFSQIQHLEIDSGIKEPLYTKISQIMRLLDDIENGDAVSENKPLQQCFNQLRALGNLIRAQKGKHIPEDDAINILAAIELVYSMLVVYSM